MSTSPTHSSRSITDSKGIDSPEGKVAPRKDRRQRNRVMCEGLSCNLGSVIGLSGTGMRIRARGWCRIRQEDILNVTLNSSDLTVKVQARVAWVKKVGVFQYEAGLAFLEMSHEQKQHLGLLAQISMPKMTIRRGTLPDLPTD